MATAGNILEAISAYSGAGYVFEANFYHRQNA